MEGLFCVLCGVSNVVRDLPKGTSLWKQGCLFLVIVLIPVLFIQPFPDKNPP